MKLIEKEKEDFWSKTISLELTIEEFAILLSCLWVTPPSDVVDMSRKHLGIEVTNSKLSKKLHYMANEGTELFKKL